MRRVAVAAASGLLGLTLVGCGAGQDAATAQDRPSVPGVNVSDAGIAARNAAIEFSAEGYAQGAAAPLRMALVNQTTEPVQLLEVTSPLAQTVTVTEAVTIVMPAPDPEDEPVLPLPDEPPAEAQVVIGPQGIVDATFELGGLREQLGQAGVVPVELRFDNGAVISLIAPMASPLQPQERGEPLDVGHH